MMKIQSLLVTCVPEFIQYGAIKALDSDPDVAKNSEQMKGEDRGGQPRAGRDSGVTVRETRWGDVRIPQAKKADFDCGRFTMKLLEEKGVTISPGTGFGGLPAGVSGSRSAGRKRRSYRG